MGKTCFTEAIASACLLVRLGVRLRFEVALALAGVRQVCALSFGPWYFPKGRNMNIISICKPDSATPPSGLRAVVVFMLAAALLMSAGCGESGGRGETAKGKTASDAGAENVTAKAADDKATVQSNTAIGKPANEAEAENATTKVVDEKAAAQKELLKEANDLIQKCEDQHWLIQGDSWFCCYSDFLGSNNYVQLKGIRSACTLAPISKADQLNGFEFGMRVDVSADVVRQRPQGQPWGQWSDASVWNFFWDAYVKKVNGKWTVDGQCERFRNETKLAAGDLQLEDK
ncbi:MAG TPA: hypothetical protein VGR14_19420 [Verrucomicrobiae bacterium]|nr:hypothetical protein [Verrucomicrobiae bacterium]